MSVVKITRILGWIFIVIGILGFIPGITTKGHLLGIFEVDLLHNLVHILSGLIALFASMRGTVVARVFDIAFGGIYGLIAVLGFVVPSGYPLGLFHVNMADNYLHAVLALVFLAVGIFGKDK